MKQSLLILFLIITIRVMAPSGSSIIICKSPPCQRTFSVQDVLNAILIVENGYKDNPIVPDAKGRLQQRTIFVRDVNRILGYEKFKLEDRFNLEKAIQMFFIYQKYYNPEMNIEKMARIQVAGPDGYNKECSVSYWKLVKNELYK